MMIRIKATTAGSGEPTRHWVLEVDRWPERLASALWEDIERVRASWPK
jgi:hypothetical protein